MKNTELKKEIRVTAQILKVLAENKCTVAEANSALHLAENEIKDSATVPEKDYLSELTDCFQKRGLLPHQT